VSQAWSVPEDSAKGRPLAKPSNKVIRSSARDGRTMSGRASALGEVAELGTDLEFKIEFSE
jgi:hypothetical protein